MSMSNTTKRVREIRRNTRRKFSSEEKIRIILVKKETPQLCWGGTQSLTISGIS